jgi:hypothetical protein
MSLPTFTHFLVLLLFSSYKIFLFHSSKNSPYKNDRNPSSNPHLLCVVGFRFKHVSIVVYPNSRYAHVVGSCSIVATFVVLILDCLW